MVGSAIWRRLQQEGGLDLFGATSEELDLRDSTATLQWLKQVRPDTMVIAAARVGGIGANAAEPATFLSDNLRIQLSLIDGAHEVGVERLLFLGSSCIYPKFAAQPISEDALLTGHLEPTNDAYAIAKIAGIMHVQSMRRQFGHHYISAMPSNLYGPGDNFSLDKSHVLPAMIRKFHEAKQRGEASVTLWGTGTPRREFLHVDDLADAVMFLLKNYDDSSHVNVGSGTDLAISELATLVANIVGFTGTIQWDTSRPDGTPKKLLDTSKLTRLGWTPSIELRDGIESTYQWFLDNYDGARL